jgi:hypothetical protein
MLGKMSREETEMTGVTREKSYESWRRWEAKTASRISRDRREKTIVGKTVKETKRIISVTVQAISEKINPSPNPWEEDDWMAI